MTWKKRWKVGAFGPTTWWVHGGMHKSPWVSIQNGRFFDDWGSHSRKPPYGRVRTWGIQMAIWMETDDKPVDLGVPNFQTKHRLVGNHYDFTDKTEY